MRFLPLSPRPIPLVENKTNQITEKPRRTAGKFLDNSLITEVAKKTVRQFITHNFKWKYRAD